MTYKSIYVQSKAEYATKQDYVKNKTNKKPCIGIGRQGLNLHICDPSVIAQEKKKTVQNSQC